MVLQVIWFATLAFPLIAMWHFKFFCPSKFNMYQVFPQQKCKKTKFRSFPFPRNSKKYWTRMHSSRMRTAHSSSHHKGGLHPPPGAGTPWSRHTPPSRHPPRAGPLEQTSQSRHPPGAGTPPLARSPSTSPLGVGLTRSPSTSPLGVGLRPSPRSP